MRSFLALVYYVIVILAILGLAYWITRYIGGRGGLGLPSQASGGLRMKILAQTAVSREQRLVVAEAAGRYFLLGVSPGSIVNLAELTQEDMDGWQPWSDEKEESRRGGFSEVLARLEKNRKPR